MGGSVVIVGGGLGGLATAARLQHDGWRVTLLEKNDRVGGRCNVIRHRGFTFDMGPTLLLMPDVLRSLFSSLDRDLEDYIELMRCDPNYRIKFSDGSSLEVSAHWDRMEAQLEEMEPGATDSLRRYLADAGYKYRVSRERFVERNFRNLREFATPSNLYYLLTTHTLRKLDRHVADYFSDPRLALAFTFQTMYLGLAPRDAPSVYSLLPYTEFEEGIWHPRGGMVQIAEALERVAIELGVEVDTGTEVVQIQTRGRQVTGVETASGRVIPADVVVTNADLPYAYANLVPDERRGPMTDRALRRLQYGSSAFLLYLGVDCRYPDLVHHNAYLSADPEANFDAIFSTRRLPTDPSFYVGAASRTDPTMAPEGKDALYVLVPAPVLSDGVCWEKMRDTFRNQMLDKMESVGFANLRNHIEFEQVFTPEDFRSVYNTSHGNAFGISHGFRQVGYMRPANRARELDNLYFVGASTVPGGGVPMVIIGSKLVAERVHEEIGRA